jgi:hypothetical protein
MGVEQNTGNARFLKGKAHEANAAQVRFLLIFGNDHAKSSDNSLRSGSKSHDALVLGGDGKVVEGNAGKMAAISGFLGQALGERSQDIVLSTANHGDTVPLVSNVAKFVNALCGTLFTLGVEHLFD